MLKKNLKYIIAYLLWVCYWYYIFWSINDFGPVSEPIDKIHRTIYGEVFGFVIICFWYISDNFNPGEFK